MSRSTLLAGLSLFLLLGSRFAAGAASSTGNEISTGEARSAEQERIAQLRALDWVKGPTTVQIAGNSSLKVPDGYVFLDVANTDKFLVLNQNLPGGKEVMVAPRDMSWSAYLAFDDAGLVKDDEKIDADELLKTLKANNEAGNEVRKQRGWPTLRLVDWANPPKYNSTTKRLEWATLIESNGEQGANFFTKILGRRGYTSVVLVADTEQLRTAETALNTVLGGYSFNSGETYTAWREGDKVAKYGLAALVLGGAAAVATKKGFWAVLASFFAVAWKFVAAAVVGFGAWLRSLFSKKKV